MAAMALVCRLVVVIVCMLIVDCVELKGDCLPSFELMSGMVYIGSEEMMETKQGVVQLAECIEYCRNNVTCQALNFETGLCVLFAVSLDRPGMVARSQEPVFTLFAAKVCLPLDRAKGTQSNGTVCDRPWSFEVVPGHALNAIPRRRVEAVTRASCMALCLAEKSFACKSANFDSQIGECQLNELDRFSLPVAIPGPGPTSGPGSGPSLRRTLYESPGVDFLESNCVHQTINKQCNFTKIDGQLLKTVDAIHEKVIDIQACRELCVEETKFACRTFDFGETGYQQCRLSHHSVSSVDHLQEPYLEISTASTFQLAACYDVTIECGPTSMVARFTANKAFSGKVYAKRQPSLCSMEVEERLEFAIELPYHERDCGVRLEAPGRYATDIVLQHHKLVVTSHDVGLSARCAYSLSERSVGLGVQMELLDTTLEGSNWQDTAFIDSPVVSMRITDRQGGDIRNAQVGDALSLRFQIADPNSPYQMFVRELVALDGVGESEVLLIDSLGCPTDPTIMGAISVVGQSSDKTLQAPFDAFKFPGSQVVQFKALVTPCVPSCEPVRCEVDDLYGVARIVGSLGRRRRDVLKGEKVLFFEPVRTSTQRLRVSDKLQEPSVRGGRSGEMTGAARALGSVAGVVLIIGCAILIATGVADHAANQYL